MKRVFLSIPIVAMALLVATPAIAGRGRGGDDAPPPRAQDGGPGGPGRGLDGPGGPQGGRGHHPQGGPNRFIEAMLKPEMAEALELNPDQIAALKMGLEACEKKGEALRDKLQAAGKKQAALLSVEGEVDEAALMKAIERSGRIRTQLAKLRMKPILLVKKTLTPEQIKMARTMMRKRMQKRQQSMGRRRPDDRDRDAWRRRRQEEDVEAEDGE